MLKSTHHLPQNTSPATSVKGLEPWEHEDLKDILRDLNSTRDQLLALQHLVSTRADQEGAAEDRVH